MKTFLPHVAALVLTLGLASAGGDVIRMDSTPVFTEKERADLQKATASLTGTGTDLAALEVLIPRFDPEIESIGGSLLYAFQDPTRRAAWKALLDWYSIDFLERVLKTGSDRAAYWALRRLIPTLEKLRTAESARTRAQCFEFIESNGLLTDREEFLKSLQEKDEEKLSNSLAQMMDVPIRINPKLTPEIWAVLIRAKSEQLIQTCLRYKWLFDLPTWDADKTRLLTHLIRAGKDPSPPTSTAPSACSR